MYQSITSYPATSFRAVCSIAVPLQLSVASNSLMFFMTRFYLARYSELAMAGAVQAALTAMIVSFIFTAAASICTVFVGRYYGAGENHKIGQPVWQMIWFALSGYIIFIPLALAVPNWLFPPLYQKAASSYFSILMLFGPCTAIVAALAGFFIGRGKVRIVTLISVGVNILNILLSPVLIFGYGKFAGLGIDGGALAIGLSQLVAIVILLTLFLRPQHRQTFNTLQWRFNWAVFSECLRVGLPKSISHFVEIAAWVIAIYLMALRDPIFPIINSIATSLTLVFNFFEEGMSQTAAAIASNLLGAKQFHQLWQLWRTCIAILGVFVAIPFYFLVIKPNILAHLFLGDNFTPGQIKMLYATLTWVWLYILVDGITWISAGILTAYKDTRYIMWVNGLANCLLCLLPIYLFVYHWPIVGMPMVWVFCVIYTATASSAYIWRLRKLNRYN